ncbi:hypothetical protein BC829DRAFT_387937, partial [Chytridium lagenaria]
EREDEDLFFNSSTITAAATSTVKNCKSSKRLNLDDLRSRISRMASSLTPSNYTSKHADVNVNDNDKDSQPRRHRSLSPIRTSSSPSPSRLRQHQAQNRPPLSPPPSSSSSPIPISDLYLPTHTSRSRSSSTSPIRMPPFFPNVMPSSPPMSAHSSLCSITEDEELILDDMLLSSSFSSSLDFSTPPSPCSFDMDASDTTMLAPPGSPCSYRPRMSLETITEED